jgi:hypothetical protein
MAKLALLLGDKATAESAARRAKELTKKIEAEYYDSARDVYAFSRNADGTVDRAATVYPMIAWWNGDVGLEHAEASFQRWASHDFSTDWGLRDVAESDSLYDPISYHQGSVWPLFTGWAAVAEYRAGHVLSGYAHLMQNAGLTTTQDLGAVTELLSGTFFQPFGRSTSHQLWSSAMVITPALRGLLGIDADGLTESIHLHPHLPADWDRAEVQRLHVGRSVCSLDYERQGGNLVVKVTTLSGPMVRLTSEGKDVRPNGDGTSIAFALPAVEVAAPHDLPLPGARTSQMKVLSETVDSHGLQLKLEAAAGSVVELRLRRNQAKLNLHIDGGTLVGATGRRGGDGGEEFERIVVKFAAGSDYQQQVVKMRW